ncbi:MAG: hypothetical protein K0A93_05140, partial [Desulfuromonadaceae bacterium]|nr:hypothetical protein [Desulfuromonadaceae bacterium]
MSEVVIYQAEDGNAALEVKKPKKKPKGQTYKLQKVSLSKKAQKEHPLWLFLSSSSSSFICAYSDEFVHSFQRKPATDSEAIRPPFGAQRRWWFLSTPSGRIG